VKFNRNTLLVIVGVIVGVLLLLAGILLYRGISRFSEAENKLKSSMLLLKGFYGKDPFPSEENIARERENVGILNRRFEDLLGGMRAGQIESVKKTPSTFMILFSDTKIKMVRMARERGVEVPENFAFGFDRYSASGILPAPGDVPRLTQQLAVMERLCRIQFEENISELVLVVRDQFEDSAERAGGGGRPSRHGRPSRPGSFQPGAGTQPRLLKQNKRAGLMEEDSLYAKLHFIVELKTKEAALFNVLNRLAANRMFAVVTSVEIKKDSPDVLSVKEKAVEPAEDAIEAPVTDYLEAKSRLERLVSGPDLEKPMSVILEIDVYRFRAPEKAASEEI